MIRVADYIAQFLVDKGVEDIFVLTGNGSMYLNDGIASQPRLNYIAARHETAATLMAESYARLKQSLGAVCVTSGPGAANAVSGLVEAWVDSAPIMVISGQVQKTHTTRLANTPNLRTFGNAEIDIISIVKPITKYAEMITEPGTIRYHLEKAFHLATTERPGPVWIDVPMDIQSALVDPALLLEFSPSHEVTPLESIQPKLKELISLLKKAKKPLFVAGHGVRQSKSIKEFKKLIKSLDIPVMFSRLGLDILPFSDPRNVGLGGIKGQRYCKNITSQTDLVVSFGNRLSIPFVGYKSGEFAPNAKKVMIDIEESELLKPGINIDLPIRADLKIVISELTRLLKKEKLPNTKSWLKYCQKLKIDYPMITPEMKENPINLYHFMSRLDTLSKKNNIFITDAGSNYYVGGQVYKYQKGQRELTSGAFAAMGLTVPLAIGASIGDKKAQILAVTGDGSIELNIQELKTTSYYNLNIKLFVINNGGYVSMRNWQDNFFEGRRIGSDDDTGAETLNFKDIAQAFSLSYESIKDVGEIDAKIRKVIKDDKPMLIEVFCDDKQKIIEPIEDLAY